MEKVLQNLMPKFEFVFPLKSMETWRMIEDLMGSPQVQVKHIQRNVSSTVVE